MIRKAVIPAAGFGTRFLPATKSQPKEMLPIVDTPVIQYVVEEAVAAGITDILMIIGKSKRAIEEHFYRNFDLEAELAEKNKTAELEQLRRISDLANVHFVWQKELNGLGDAINYAQYHVGNEPFAILLGDTLLESKTHTNVTAQLLDVHSKYGGAVVALEEVEQHKVNRYGIMDGEEIEPDLYKVKDFIEKPEIDEAPSRLAIAGRYVFTPEIFDFLRETPVGKNNELQLTDAMRLMVSSRDAYGVRFRGKRYDIGNKLDFLKTNIEFALRRDDLHDPLMKYMRELVSDH